MEVQPAEEPELTERDEQNAEPGGGDQGSDGAADPGNDNGNNDTGGNNDGDNGVIEIPEPDAGAPADPPDAGEEPDPAEPLVLSCDTYCDAMEEACPGPFAQYDSRQECIAMCEDTPLGALSDVTGDTIGCRYYHAGNAVRQNNPAVHCRHAGPTGGAACGRRCEALCDRATKLCTRERGYQDVYVSEAECLALCEPDESGFGGFGVDSDLELPRTGDTVNCRINALREAYSDIDPDNTANDSAARNCPDVGADSRTCS